MLLNTPKTIAAIAKIRIVCEKYIMTKDTAVIRIPVEKAFFMPSNLENLPTMKVWEISPTTPNIVKRSAF